MPDLGILEILIAFFLFMPLTQPYVKAFGSIEGFVWFPPVALACTLAIFPAYGFRPECLPLLIFCFICCALDFSALRAHIVRLRYRDYIEKGPLYFLVMLVCLVFCVYISLYFLPLSDSRVASFTNSFDVRDNINNCNYNIRVYAEDAVADAVANASADAGAVVLVAPPPIGSVFIVDRICSTLASRGFTTLAFSRNDFDMPSSVTNTKSGGGFIADEVLTYNRYKFPPFNIIKQYAASVGASYAGAGIAGGLGGDASLFEKARVRDIEFLLPFISARYKGKVFILSYDDAASAALLLSGNADFIEANPALAGIIAVEAHIHSSYTNAPADVSADTSAGALV
jgi:hypothetical protein